MTTPLGRFPSLLLGLLAASLSLLAQTPSFNIVDYTASSLPALVATADLNNDGKPDLIVAAGNILFGSSVVIEIYLNTGNGTMKQTATITPPQTGTLSGSPSPCVPYAIAAGDFFKTGKPGLLLVCASSPVILVYPGNGDGTFGSTPVLSTAPTGVLAFVDELKVAVGDFNGDGFLDIAFAEVNQSPFADPTQPLSGNIAVLLGNGAGKFLTIEPVTGVAGASIVAGDLIGNRKLDLVISQPKNLTFDFLLGAPVGAGPLQILLGKGDGTFTIGASIPMPFPPGPVTIADVNGDGKPDLIVDGFLNGVAVLLGNGDGTFKQTFNQNVGGGTLGSIQVVDLLGTGKPGLLIPLAECCSDQLIFLAGNGDGTFQNPVPIAIGFSSPDIVVADFNGDGKPDVALSSLPINLANLSAIFSSGVLGNTTGNTFAIALNLGPAPSITYVNGASFANGTLAAGSIVSAFASGGIAAGVDTPSTLPLPTTDQGVSITVKDMYGSIRSAALFYVSPTQINFQIPDQTAPGATSVIVDYGQNYITQLTVAAVSPGIFQANSTTHLLSAQVLRVHSDGSSDPVTETYQLNASNNVVAAPISLGLTSDQVFLTLFGTGVKNAKAVTATIKGTSVSVPFFGAQGTFVGLDQVNLGPLPQSLAGAGNVNLTLTADTVAANVVNLTFQ